VVLKTQVHGRAIQYLQDVRANMVEEESVDASGQAKEKTSSDCDIVVEE